MNQTPSVFGEAELVLARGVRERDPGLREEMERYVRGSEREGNWRREQVAPAAPREERCPLGMGRSADTGGECCWPGQAWSTVRGKCVGVPASCPAGMISSGETCISSIPEGYVEIPPGTFMQGSPAIEGGRNAEQESPQRQVTISRAFALKATPVTQGEWAELMGSYPSHFLSCGSNCPVEQVSWFAAVDYLNRLSEREGLEKCYEGSGESIRFRGLQCRGYRLPTEAEWEYAARAGTTGARYGNLSRIGWHEGNSGWGGAGIGSVVVSSTVGDRRRWSRADGDARGPG